MTALKVLGILVLVKLGFNVIRWVIIEAYSRYIDNAYIWDYGLFRSLDNYNINPFIKLLLKYWAVEVEIGYRIGLKIASIWSRLSH